ncbi:hypothetical protein HanIR_Chr04g0190091 [Helianthus annuus]|nr:hypothetical protein HanIR_Chr04g0190091 [Helianthus annuus]
MTSKRTVRFGFRSWFGAWLNSGSRRFCSRSRLVSVDDDQMKTDSKDA